MIGVKNQIVEYPPQESTNIEDKLFKFDGDNNFYLILDTTFSSEGINRMNPLLKDDEIFGSKPGIFTYIIGSQATITNNQIFRDLSEPTDNICNIENMHIWAKLALSTQEINSKHNSILQDSYLNYLNIQNSIENNKTIDETIKYNGIIDRIFYAGELKIDKKIEDEKDKNKFIQNVYINFLSGTFMRDYIDCGNPPEETVNCINRFFKEKIFKNNNSEIVFDFVKKSETNDTSVIEQKLTIDTTCNTFITQKMEKTLLDDYVRNIDLKVGVFTNEPDAKKYNKKNTELAKLNSKINAQRRSKFPNESAIENLEKERDILLSNNFGMQMYQPFSGGNKKKTKRRRYRKINRNNTKYNKRSKKNVVKKRSKRYIVKGK